MKAEERHALQQNELEEYTGHLKPFLEKYGRLLALGAVALVLLFVAVSVWRGQARGDREAGWAGLFEAMPDGRADVGKLENVVDLEANTGAAVWAHVKAGNEYLRTAAGSAFTDRKSADGEYELAREHFEKALAYDDAPDSARAQALFGLASVEEATAGDPAPAIEAYQRVADEYPTLPLAPAAELRLEALGRQTTGPFLAWFDTQNPAPGPEDDLAVPLDRGPGATLTEEDELLPGVDPPADPAPTDPAAAETPAPQPAAETPAPQPAADTPEPEPAAETPAEPVAGGESGGE